jgi:esterase/lipase superfamily enzyme
MFLKQKGFRLKKTYKKTLIFLISNLTDNKVIQINKKLKEILSKKIINYNF